MHKLVWLLIVLIPCLGIWWAALGKPAFQEWLTIRWARNQLDLWWTDLHSGDPDLEAQAVEQLKSGTVFDYDQEEPE
jgi:hypothetical protein